MLRQQVVILVVLAVILGVLAGILAVIPGVLAAILVVQRMAASPPERWTRY
jgi:hypothetical protein